MNKPTEAFEKQEQGGLRRELGRVVSHPAFAEGRPYLHRKFIEVLHILDLLGKGEDVFKHYPDLEESDVKACKAYQARFLSATLTRAFDMSAHQPVMMLDENLPYMALYEVVHLFGRSSHVLAEGLYGARNDDEADIWKHLLDHRYKAIITNDTDFRRISRDYRHMLAERHGSVHDVPEDVHVPSVILVTRDISHRKLVWLLAKNRQAIDEFLEQKSVFFAELSDKGLLVPPYCIWGRRSVDAKPIHG